MRPDVDLSGSLLNALADEPKREWRRVRLVHRMADAFEFVHDQMLAYLAARWLCQPAFDLEKLENLIATPSLWQLPASDRRNLGNFLAALLDDERIEGLRLRIEDKEDWDALRRELQDEVKRRALSATHPV